MSLPTPRSTVERVASAQRQPHSSAWRRSRPIGERCWTQSGLSRMRLSSKEGGSGSGSRFHGASAPRSGIGRPPTPQGPWPVSFAEWGAIWATSRKKGRGSVLAARTKSIASRLIARVM